MGSRIVVTLCADMSPDNITGDFRGSKSASMHGLDEIKSSSRENSPRSVCVCVCVCVYVRMCVCVCVCACMCVCV